MKSYRLLLICRRTFAKKEEPINYEEIAKIAECSFDFFQNVFSYMNGISFAEYIRLRKLTLAG